MDGAEVVNTAEQKNPLGKGLLTTGWTPITATQEAQMGTEGGVEASM